MNFRITILLKEFTPLLDTFIQRPDTWSSVGEGIHRTPTRWGSQARYQL